MAYENSTASDIVDLMTKLDAFATANGWTRDEFSGTPKDVLCLHKNGVYVNFRWATTSQTAVGIYHALGYTTSATKPGNHTSDSGNGYYSATTVTNANILTSRYALVPNSSMTYWFFENDASPAYIHVVVTTGTLQYSHFGFGELIKQGTWTGGEYAYGHYYNSAGTNVQLNETSSFLLDGGLGNATPTTYRTFAATVHIESLPGQGASTKWGLCWGGDNAGTDRATLTRYNIQGGFRAGPVASAFARFTSSPTTGLSAMYPINLFYDGAGSPRQWYPLGYMGDVRGIDTLNYSEAQEITVGADTWIVFPVTYKPAVASLGACRTMGVAYKKVTA